MSSLKAMETLRYFVWQSPLTVQHFSVFWLIPWEKYSDESKKKKKKSQEQKKIQFYIMLYLHVQLLAASELAVYASNSFWAKKKSQVGLQM